MGRNDLCFCGSGLKQKRCHPDIHEDSVAARLIKLYHRIDKDIAQFQQGKEEQVICRKGCSGCCSDVILTTNIEFDMIVRELRKWEQGQLTILYAKVRHAWETFVQTHPGEAEHYSKAQENNGILFSDVDMAMEAVRLPLPCPFLFDNTCSIYPVRPLICRLHGVTHWGDRDEFHVCDKIDGKQEWQMEVPKYVEEEAAQFYCIWSPKHNIRVALRSSMFLWAMYLQFIESGYGIERIPFEEGYFIVSYDNFADNFVESVVRREGIGK